jgi:hypothetical protein
MTCRSRPSIRVCCSRSARSQQRFSTRSQHVYDAFSRFNIHPPHPPTHTHTCHTCIHLSQLFSLQAPAETGQKRSRDESRFQYGKPSFLGDKAEGNTCCEFEGVTPSPVVHVLPCIAHSTHFPHLFQTAFLFRSCYHQALLRLVTATNSSTHTFDALTLAGVPQPRQFHNRPNNRRRHRGK